MSAPRGPAPPPRALIIAALLGVQALFGVSYVVIKAALDEGVDPLEWSVVRVVCSTACLWALARAFGAPLAAAAREWRGLAGCAVLGVVVNQICFVVGLRYTTPGQSALINVTIPVTALVFAWLLRTERPDLARGLGVAAAAGGLTLMLAGGLDADWRLGNWFTFVNACSFGLFLVVSRRVFQRVHPLAATAVLFAFGTAGIVGTVTLAWLGGWWVPTTPWAALSPGAWGALVYVILGATVGTYALNAFALRHADASVVGFFIFLQPLIATALSAYRGSEALGGRFFLAAALVAIGVGLALRRRAAPPRGT